MSSGKILLKNNARLMRAQIPFVCVCVCLRVVLGLGFGWPFCLYVIYRLFVKSMDNNGWGGRRSSRC